MQKHSLFIAYFCYFIGGLWGLHHIYLKRPDHAFLISATIGGYFLAGLLRDLFKLPSYVKEANHDPEYERQFKNLVKSSTKPKSSWARNTAFIIVANLFSHLLLFAIPDTEHIPKHIHDILLLLLVPLGASIGVWLVGNVGREQTKFKPLTLISYGIAIICYFLNIQYAIVCAIGVTVANNMKFKSHRLKTKQMSLTRSIAIFLTFSLVYWLLFSSWFYFNCKIDDEESGREIKCTEAVNNFVKSPAFQDLSIAWRAMIEEIRQNGFASFWIKLVSELDLNGRGKALEVFNLPENASQDEIQTTYRQLSRKYHPDREKNPFKKIEMHNKFIEVQEAYRVLKRNSRTEL